MCRLFCGCYVTQEEWGHVSGHVPVPRKAEATKCQWCHTWHVPGKGCSA